MSNLGRDEILAMVAHELRAPLSAMANSVQLLRELQQSDEGRAASCLANLARQTEYMSRLVDDLVDVSRVGHAGLNVRKERLDLRVPVRAAIDATRPLIELRKHQLHLDLVTHPIWMDADPTRLQQAVVNLLLNSAQYTEPGGLIQLRLEHELSEAVLKVRDTGVGICPDGLERIFEPFARADARQRSPGLGIGLAVVRDVVRQHGGAVEARSSGLHQGSEFIVRLPALASSVTQGPVNG